MKRPAMAIMILMVASCSEITRNIVGEEGQPPATGITGNRNAHGVTDNDAEVILLMVRDFCKKNGGKCNLKE